MQIMYTNLSLSIKEKEDRKNSYYLSVAIHIILILMLLMIPFKKAITPNPELQGIVVNFGNPNAGNENSVNEPLLAEATEKEEPKEEKQAEETPAKIEETKPVKETPPAKVETQTIEEKSPVVATKDVVLEKQTKTVETSTATPSSTASNTSSQAKSNEKSEADKAAESKAKFGSLFGGGSTGNVDAEKGEDFGVPDASVLEGLSTGTGEAGDGLGSRGLVYEPKIEDNTQKSGTVVVKVCVNKLGNVVSAKYTQRGSSTTDSYLIDLAERSAKKYQFTPSDAAEQCGTITIEFIVK